MKNYSFKFIGLTFFLLSCVSSQRGHNCNNFKTGKFKLNSHSDSSFTIIERNNSTQKETNSKTGQVLTANIIWKNECEYELLYQSQTGNPKDTIHSLLQTKPLKTKITKTTKDYCIFEAYVDNLNIKYIDTLWRLKNQTGIILN